MPEQKESKGQADVPQEARNHVATVLANCSEESRKAGHWVIRKDGRICMTALPLSDFKSEDDFRTYIESELAGEYRHGTYHILAMDPLGKKKIPGSDLFIKVERNAISETNAMVDAAQKATGDEFEKIMSLQMKRQMMESMAGPNRGSDDVTKKLLEELTKKNKGGDEMSPMMLYLMTQGNQAPNTNIKSEIMEAVGLKLEGLVAKLQPPKEDEMDKMFKTMMMKKMMDGNGEKKEDSMVTLMMAQMKEDGKRREDEMKVLQERIRTENMESERRHKEEMDRRERERKEEREKYDRERKEDKANEEKKLAEERRRSEEEGRRRDKELELKEQERKRQEQFDKEFQLKMFGLIKEGSSSNVKDILEIAKTNTNLLTQAGTSMFNAQVNATKSLIEIGSVVKRKFETDENKGGSKVVEKIIEAAGNTISPLIEMNKKLELFERAKADPTLAALLNRSKPAVSAVRPIANGNGARDDGRLQVKLPNGNGNGNGLSGGVDMLIEKFVKEAPDIVETMAYSIEEKGDPVILVDMVIRHANVRTILATWPYKRLRPRIEKALPETNMEAETKADVAKILAAPEAEAWWDTEFRPLLREYIQALHQAATQQGDEELQPQEAAPAQAAPTVDGKK